LSLDVLKFCNKEILHCLMIVS